MKNLFLMRHAKSDWEADFSEDHNRPIGGRGRKNAKDLGDFLKDRNFRVDSAYISSSKRTVQTFEILGKKQKFAREVIISEEIYLADQEKLLDELKKVSDTKNSVLILGHNPGLEDLANFLLGYSMTVFGKVPTSSFLSFQLNIDKWSETCFGCGQILQFWIPLKVMSHG